ncbi:MAG: hypothetical protein QM779_11790 [Propionicimonas sp.]|uniref:hypothetical protein n=1 Tax=Propionicimonas sp. TaxID=1955623 RepID=UPI003D0D7CC8
MLTVLCSAAGSPGVTTTGLALALGWPRPVVLVEADSSGNSGLLAGYFRGQLDQPGLVDLVIAHRSDLLAEAVPRLLFSMEGSQASVLFGLRSHEQAAGAGLLWPSLLDLLRGLDVAGTDVIVDAGRLGLPGWPQPLLAGADAVLLLARSDLPGLAGARSWAAALAAEEAPGHPVRIVLVGEGRPYQAREVTKTLGVPVLGAIEWAPEHARVFSHGQPPPEVAWWRRIGRRGDARQAAFDGSAYLRSVRALTERISSLGEAPAPVEFGSVLAQVGATKEGRSL